MRKKYLTTILLVITLVSVANEKHLDSSDYYKYLNEEKIDVNKLELIIEESKLISPEDVIIRDIHVLHPAFRNKVILLFIEAKNMVLT